MISAGSPVDQVITSGTFSLDGGTWDVDNNVWIVGDENGVIVIDAAHDVEEISLGIGGIELQSIRTSLLTLPGDTTVRTGHGDPTTVGAEAPHLEERITRGR